MAVTRRFVQNAQQATSATIAIPKAHKNISPVTIPDSPLPTTPRKPRISISDARSPSATPSVSSSTPFDWDAARSMKPAPYASPLQNKQRNARKSLGVAAPKRVIKKRGLIERITDWPMQFILDFPQNLPLPNPTTSASLLAAVSHFLHLCVRLSQVRKVPDSDLAWEDMYREDDGDSWFDWTTPVTLLLISASVLNVLYLLTRTKIYRLHKRTDPVSSPHASFTASEISLTPPPSPPLTSCMWYLISMSFRWLLNMKPPRSPWASDEGKVSKVQQLEVWTPAELETVLFCLYSPAHALLWMATGSSNWMLMLLVMGLVTVQLRVMVRSYTALIKDKDILAAEVMHEYNTGFVYPRVNPVRRDVAVMTNQSEVVNIWDEF